MLFISLIILFFSVILHELAHGYVAEYFGDPTPRIQGRLTINPIPHIDFFGTILIPLFLIATGSNFLFGWAKPVEYNPYNFKNNNSKLAEFLVSIAGVVANILIAIVFAVLINLHLFSSGIESVFVGIIFLNLLLAVINLIPFPPLDGFRAISALSSYQVKNYFRVKFAPLLNNFYLMIGLSILFLISIFDFILALVYFLTNLLI